MKEEGRQFFSRLILSDCDMKYLGSILKDILVPAIFSPNFYFSHFLLSIIMSDSKTQDIKLQTFFVRIYSDKMNQLWSFLSDHSLT